MILDADVLIDLKRGHNASAMAWFASLPECPSVSCFAAMELLFGSRNAQELSDVEIFLIPFPVVWPTQSDVLRAISYANLKLKGGLGLLDALTASLAIAVGEPLATFNTKHFRHVPGIQLVEPYPRTTP